MEGQTRRGTTSPQYNGKKIRREYEDDFRYLRSLRVPSRPYLSPLKGYCEVTNENILELYNASQMFFLLLATMLLQEVLE